MRPSAPARKRQPRRNQRWRSCCCRSREMRPVLGRTTRRTPRPWPAPRSRGVQPPVPGDQIRRVAEALQVGIEAGDAVRVRQPHAATMAQWLTAPPSTRRASTLRPNAVSFPGLWRRMAWVCGANRRSNFSLRRHRLAPAHPPRGLRDGLVHQRQGRPRRSARLLPWSVTWSRNAVATRCRLPPTRPGEANALAVGLLAVLGRLLALAPGHAMGSRRRTADAARPGAEGVLPQRGPRPEDLLGPPGQPTDDPHPVTAGLAGGGVAHRRLHHRPVDAQRAATGDPTRLGQGDGAVVERGDRFRPDAVRPADAGGVVGHGRQRDPTALAQHQAVVDELRGFGIAPAGQALDHQQAEEDRHRRGMPPTRGGPRATFLKSARTR